MDGGPNTDTFQVVVATNAMLKSISTGSLFNPNLISIHQDINEHASVCESEFNKIRLIFKIDSLKVCMFD